MTADFDIVVVGAGAAGLSAAKTLQSAGARFLLVEASGRRGGRAWTDTETLPGVAFDRGAHWLHAALENPLTPLAKALGFRLDADFTFEIRRYFRDGALLDAAQTKTLEDRVSPFIDAIDDLPRGAAVSDVMAADHPDARLFAHIMGLWTSHPPAGVSAADFCDAAPEYDNFPVIDGLGALVLKVAEGVPATCDTPVTHVDASGRRVRLETPRGAISAKAVIVTASTSVLAAGGITFTPEPPPALMDAMAGCPVGVCERVGLLFDAPLEILPEGVMIRAEAPRATELGPITFLRHAAEPRLVSAMIGGDDAEALAAEGADAMQAFAMTHLAAIFGADARRGLKAATTSGWRQDPLIRGGYSMAQPGREEARGVLAGAMLDDRLFFAGEATAGAQYGTVHGAHRTGIDAAERAMRAVAAT